MVKFYNGNGIHHDNLWALHYFVNLYLCTQRHTHTHKTEDNAQYAMCMRSKIYITLFRYYALGNMYRFDVVVWYIVCLAFVKVSYRVYNIHCILSIDISVWMTTEQTLKCKSINDRPHQTHTRFGFHSCFPNMHSYDCVLLFYSIVCYNVGVVI